MASQKYCDKCDYLAKATDLKCTACGGTSFTWRHNESIEIDLGVSNWHISNANEPSIFEGLRDTKFEKYVTKKIVRFCYILSLISTIILAVFGFIGLWMLTDFTQSESVIPFFIFTFGFSLVVVLLVLWLALTRLRLESFTALVDIARNTREHRVSNLD